MIACAVVPFFIHNVRNQTSTMEVIMNPMVLVLLFGLILLVLLYVLSRTNKEFPVITTRLTSSPARISDDPFEDAVLRVLKGYDQPLRPRTLTRKTRQYGYKDASVNRIMQIVRQLETQRKVYRKTSKRGHAVVRLAA
jgi:hypothetical protein